MLLCCTSWFHLSLRSLLHSCGGWWISSVEGHSMSVSNKVCGACSHASWPTGRRGPGLNSFTCKRVSASATQPKPIQPMDAPTTVPIPIPHAHMTSPLHCSYLDPCLPKCQTETVLFHLFHCLVQATETLCAWRSSMPVAVGPCLDCKFFHFLSVISNF